MKESESEELMEALARMGSMAPTVSEAMAGFQRAAKLLRERMATSRSLTMRPSCEEDYPFAEKRMDAISGIKRHCEWDLLNSDCKYLELGCRGCIF
jgi:hypothetical protein